ncbi:MAG: Two component transcriptional regulator, LuxR family [Pedosphaera sp.]|nr:Two component transcriptional regulator, LuxR family [Pedosphaera sp.]
MKDVRILLADDHTLLRAGIRSLLEKMTGVEVVGEAADGREALTLVRELQPSIVLMDIAMAGLNGLEATVRIVKEFPNTRVIILSMHANEEYVLQTLRAGALGYLLKDAATAELELAIQAIARGDTYLSPAISKRVIEDYVGRTNGEKSPMEQLTPRQREILQLIAEGKTTKEMAFLLSLSVKTVETHRAQLMERLNIHDVPGLVRHAMRMGLVPPEQQS